MTSGIDAHPIMLAHHHGRPVHPRVAIMCSTSIVATACTAGVVSLHGAMQSPSTAEKPGTLV